MNKTKEDQAGIQAAHDFLEGLQNGGEPNLIEVAAATPFKQRKSLWQEIYRLAQLGKKWDESIEVMPQSSSSPIVQAAYAMVDVHAKHESALAPVDEVIEQFPDLNRQQAILLWIGINAATHPEFRT